MLASPAAGEAHHYSLGTILLLQLFHYALHLVLCNSKPAHMMQLSRVTCPQTESTASKVFSSSSVMFLIECCMLTAASNAEVSQESSRAKTTSCCSCAVVVDAASELLAITLSHGLAAVTLLCNT
jgi:hypothetical protein